MTEKGTISSAPRLLRFGGPWSAPYIARDTHEAELYERSVRTANKIAGLSFIPAAISSIFHLFYLSVYVPSSTYPAYLRTGTQICLLVVLAGCVAAVVYLRWKLRHFARAARETPRTYYSRKARQLGRSRIAYHIVSLAIFLGLLLWFVWKMSDTPLLATLIAGVSIVYPVTAVLCGILLFPIVLDVYMLYLHPRGEDSAQVVED